MSCGVSMPTVHPSHWRPHVPGRVLALRQVPVFSTSPPVLSHSCHAPSVSRQAQINRRKCRETITQGAKPPSAYLLRSFPGNPACVPRNPMAHAKHVKQLYVPIVNPAPHWGRGAISSPLSRFLEISSKPLQVSPPNLQYPLSQHFYTLC